MFNRCAVILSGVIMLGSALLAKNAFPTQASEPLRPAGSASIRSAPAFAAQSEEEELTALNKTVFAENPLNELTDTPADIKGLMQSAQKNAANEVRDGAIEER